MPRLWTETIAAHRQEVREAVLDATAALVAERGLLGVTMSEIAEKTGIGRATLYKYFPDIEAILRTWHEQKIAEHLNYLEQLRARESDPGRRLQAVLEAFALISHDTRGHHGSDLAAVLHRDPSLAHAEQRVENLLRELLGEAAQAGAVRTDITSAELASYCVHALGAASSLPSKAAVQRLVAVTLAGLRPGPPAD